LRRLENPPDYNKIPPITVATLEKAPQLDKLPTYPEGLAIRLEEYLTPSEGPLRHTSLSLINTRLWLCELGAKYGRPVTLATVPEEEWMTKFDRFDAFWFMGAFRPSVASREHALHYAHQYAYALPDIQPEEDVAGSPFAIPEYSPNPLIAQDWEEWDGVVDRLHGFGKKVYLDFVPNHVALDHPWAKSHPEYFIRGGVEDYVRNPGFYYPVVADDGQTYYLAHGKDPNYPEWADTLQLNYGNPEVQWAMEAVLLELVEHCDGVRCDMAMLLNPETFLRTWGWCMSEEDKQFIWNNRFWERAIPKVKARAAELGRDSFDFLAEAYWDREALGCTFDYIYRSELYRKLLGVAAGSDVNDLRGDLGYLLAIADQEDLCHDVVYLENHDEERAARTMGLSFEKAAAAAIGLLPGTLLMINQGQEEGRQIRPPMQIGRPPLETSDLELDEYYQRLLELKRSRFFQEATVRLTGGRENDSRLLVFQAEVMEANLGAAVCVNLSREQLSCRLPEIGETASLIVCDLNSGEWRTVMVEPSSEVGIELEPCTTQIVFYENKA